MKKVFVTLCGMGILSLAVSAAQPAKANMPKVDNQARLAALISKTQGAHKDSVQRIGITVSSRAKGMNNDHIHTYHCVAVRISPKYLLASTACIAPLMTGSRDGGGASATRSYGIPLVSKDIISVTVGGEKVDFENIKWEGFDKDTSHLILIKKPTKNPGATPLLFVANKPATLASWFSKAWVNSLDSTLQVGKFKGPKISEFKFNLKFKPAQEVFKGSKALSGAPVFGVDENGVEFLLGFNNKDTKDFDPQSGSMYYYLTPQAKQFLTGKLSEEYIRDEQFFLQ